MKKLLTLILVLALGTGASLKAQNGTPGTKGPDLTLKEDVHDFGKIKEGIVAEYDFAFTNTGGQPLLLTDVRPSCGCTTPDWPKEPIQPGKSGVIKVKYNSAGRPGNFNKSITITTNVQDITRVLFIKGEVIPATDSNDPNKSPVRIGN